ncbi:MAG: SRPBCC family protein [Microthrixaceae bacterium]|nr:SRPBCC family protein [Microthrixaceae bacterium]
MADTFSVTRSTTIDAPPDAVFEHLVDFHRWVEWSPWEGLDQNMERTYSGADSGIGAVYSWSGTRKVGEGRMEITSSDPPAKLGIRLNFIKPFKAENDIVLSLETNGPATDVRWTMTGPKTLFSKIMGIFMSMDKMIGRDFEKGLAQLKATVEKSPPQR